MFGKSTAKKKPLKVSVCKLDSSGNVTGVIEDKSFEFMLNPSEYDNSYQIGYNKKEAIGQSSSDVRFGSIKPEKLKVASLIDGSGAVAQAGAKREEVKIQVKALMDIVYKYDGDKHEPNVVKVSWGSQIFYGRLENIVVNNTLFKPNGEPLRAQVQLEFIEYVSKKEEALRANRSSPDMSHLIEVKAGDTLPLLCYRVYRDSAYYLEVARINNITNFRDIKPGCKLHFPPLR